MLFAKVVLSLMLGRPAERYLDAQRAAHLQRCVKLTELKRKGNVVDALLADHAMFHLEADLRWMDVTEARLGFAGRGGEPMRAPDLGPSAVPRTGQLDRSPQRGAVLRRDTGPARRQLGRRRRRDRGR